MIDLNNREAMRAAIAKNEELVQALHDESALYQSRINEIDTDYFFRHLDDDVAEEEAAWSEYDAVTACVGGGDASADFDLDLYEDQVDRAAEEASFGANRLDDGPAVSHSGIRGGDFWAELQAEHGV